MIEPKTSPKFSRRRFLKNSLVGATGLALAGCTIDGALNDNTATEAVAANEATTNTVTEATETEAVETEAVETKAVETEAVQLDPTPACDDGDHDATIAQTAGPFYTPDTPERTSLIEDGLVGAHLVVTGQVLTTDCQPVAGALLDFWHADDAGEYDNVGYKLRGHQFADENGFYRLETIVPGLYPGRTRHIHVHAQGPNMPRLTTQMYWPDEASNANDGIYHQSLVMDVQNAADGNQTATFDFVLEA